MSLLKKSLPVLIAIPLIGLYLMGTSDFDDMQYVEQLKQEQRDRIRSTAQHDPATRAFYQMEEPSEIQSPLLARK